MDRIILYKRAFINGLFCIFLAILFMAIVPPRSLLYKCLGLSVKVELITSNDNTLIKVFYDIGNGFNENHSSSANIERGRFQILDIPILSFFDLKKLRRVRVDLGTKPGEIFIKDIKLTAVFYDFSWSAQEILNSFSEVVHIEEFYEKNGLVYVKCNGTDPGILVEIPEDIQRRFLFANALICTILICCIFIVIYFAYRQREKIAHFYRATNKIEIMRNKPI